MEQEEQQEFLTVRARGNHSLRKQPRFSKELRACQRIEEELVQEYLNETMKDIIGQCHDEYQNGVMNQIFTVQFRKNQEVEFDAFLKQIHHKFEHERQSTFEALPPEKVNVIILNKSQVREIVLHMYIYLQENPQFELVVFIANSITDLDQQNIYCFQKGLKEKKFVAVLCTFHNFESRHENSLQNFEKYHYKLYNSKDLFCKYMYNCLINETIKPYLPSDILTLISDIDYYSISFHQSCRRFMYCLERYLLLDRKERDIEYVEFEQLTNLIENTIINKFKYYPGVKNVNEKMLKVILDEKEIYTISEKAIVYEIAFASGVSGKDLIEELDIIKSIRESLKKHLGKEESFMRYVDYLDEKEESNQLVQKKKKTRADQLGIDTKKNITPKNKLENQITKIIKDATVQIRQQAACVRWVDLNYELRIKPQIPLLIKQAWLQDEETAELMEEITKNYSAPLNKYLKAYNDTDNLGHGVYLIKCLQLSGLIDINKHKNPVVFCNFFAKARFAGTKK